jgi:hypothetical protein
MVSSDFGKLDVRRHFTSGEDCAIAGEATAVAAAPAADTFKKSRRFIFRSLLAGVFSPTYLLRPRVSAMRYDSVEPKALDCRGL